MMQPLSPARDAEALTDLWSPRVIAEVDDFYVKVAKIEGEFVWHRHEEEDELFLVLEGRLRIETEDGAVDLERGEMVVVPRGVRHKAVAAAECHVLLFERKTTLHTGDVVSDLTRSIEEQLGHA